MKLQIEFYHYRRTFVVKFSHTPLLKIINLSIFCNCFAMKYELRLSASDNLRENHTTVVIHVKDVNDNPPVFERPTYRTQITEEDDRNLPKSVVQVDY